MVSLNTRDGRIDRLKGVLCLLMLLAHAVFSFGYERTDSTVWKLISHAVNLTAFPGFVFCFGFACERAYLSKHDRAAVKARLWKRFWILLAAYYVTALWLGLFGENVLSLAALTGIVHLTAISGLSFLLAFAVLFLLLLLFYDGLDRLLDRTWAAVIAVAISLGIAALPAIGLELPFIGMLIKTNAFAGFPVLPYAGFFILGALFSRRRIVWDWRAGVFALIGFMAFAAYIAFTRTLPKRFPPALCWVLGGYLPVYVLYLICGLGKGRFRDAALTPFGKHTLYYLVASNLLLVLYEFISRRTGYLMPPVLYVPGYIVLMLVCLGLMQLWRLLRKKV